MDLREEIPVEEPMIEEPSVEEILQGARANYLELIELYETLDRQIAAEVPDWAEEDRFSTLLVKICIDIALLMLGADREYAGSECQAFNALFGLQENYTDISTIAARMQEQRPGSAELFSRLDHFLRDISVAERQPEQDLLEPARTFFLNLAQVIALIDERYHPDESRFHQELNQHLRQPAELPPGTSLMLKLRHGGLQPWPMEE
ncbi:MAG TPA: hypothetical protein V6D23_19060 [Candidatus Obscuribacterales bacterium]